MIKLTLVLKRILDTNAMTAIQTLSFDLDDTLWNNKPVILQAEAAMMVWLEKNAPLLAEQFTLEALKDYKQQLLDKRPELAAKISDLRRESIRLALIESGYSHHPAHNLAAEAFTCFLKARHHVTYFEGVENTLGKLSEHYQLIAITNGNADLRRLSLNRYFTHAFNAENMGVKKPNPDIYKIALKQAKAPLEKTVHIGDCPVNDIRAAHRAGLKTIWFNPANQPWEDRQAPDGIIQSINDLPEILSTMLKS